MSRKNKIRYHSKGNTYPAIALTGRVLLRHQDEEAIAGASRGDMQIYLSTDALLGGRQGDYDAMGFEGYLKAEVFDGKGWRPLSLEEFFPGRDHYFGKRERPSDTFRFCLKKLQSLSGVQLMRTYREHYVKSQEEAP